MRRFCLFYKVVSTKLPAYSYDIIPPVRQSPRHPTTFDSISCRTEYFKNSIFLSMFFPCVIGEWNKFNREIRKSGTYNTFRKSILNFIRTSASKVYNINDAIGIKLITRLCLGFSDLCEHKFKQFTRHVKSALSLYYRSRIHFSLLSALPFSLCFAA